ncbi:hypothetical protein LEP1GSC124_3530 [Leptospira interrogans serovar Pyrogenes str. 200701872]|uniref:Uncharacterized protein n=1 Tax=Leptospira interrogans serovar Pyrogenes str. 200701872 TaxID=1193029 RepID=M7AAK7_LEPIR|nr:hypothetical protein LEP1GSC124_3530 [Leptospira interrogans serovar Pyrogenes str. 200701872]
MHENILKKLLKECSKNINESTSFFSKYIDFFIRKLPELFPAKSN